MSDKMTGKEASSLYKEALTAGQMAALGALVGGGAGLMTGEDLQSALVGAGLGTGGGLAARWANQAIGNLQGARRAAASAAAQQSAGNLMGTARKYYRPIKNIHKSIGKEWPNISSVLQAHNLPTSGTELKQMFKDKPKDVIKRIQTFVNTATGDMKKKELRKLPNDVEAVRDVAAKLQGLFKGLPRDMGMTNKDIRTLADAWNYMSGSDKRNLLLALGKKVPMETLRAVVGI